MINVIRVTCVYFHVKLNHTIGWATVGHSCSHDSAIQGWNARSLWHLGKAHLHGDMWYSSLFLHVFARFFHAFVCVCVCVCPLRSRGIGWIKHVLMKWFAKCCFDVGKKILSLKAEDIYKKLKDVSGSVDIHRADETCLIVAWRS